MKPVPKEIKASGGTITIRWNDEHPGIYSARHLRLACRCAACVDEWSHEVLVQAEQIPVDVKAVRIEAVGSYALHITWSDGHNTGIYSYDYLREACECDECRQ